MAQDSSTLQESRGNRRAAFVIVVLWLLVAVVTASTSYYVVQASQKRMLKETEQDMSAQASNNVARLTVWFGGLKKQIETFAGLDSLRLFAAEVFESRVTAPVLLELSRALTQDTMPPTSDVTGMSDNIDNDPDAVRKNILPRLPMMTSQIKEFFDKNRLLNISLLNTDFEAYVSVNVAPHMTDEQRTVLQSVVDKKEFVCLPVRRQGEVLTLEIVFPVIGPEYNDATKDKVVALLLVTCDVQPMVASITQATKGSAGVFRSFVLQHTGNNLQIIDLEAAPGIVDLPEWQLDSTGYLPLGKRYEPVASGGRTVQAYSLALPVPDMPWLVGQSLGTQRVEELYTTFRRNISIVAALIVVVAAIALAALWWWLVGSKERAAAEQIRRLFLVVNQQKQIMDGVNSALSASIVLNDLNGVIYYANQSYARMVGMSLDQLSGLSYTKLPADMARSLVTHTLAVHKSSGITSFTEVLPLEDGSRSFLTSCSPFLDESGQTTGVVSVYNDIMDLVLAQQRAQHMITQTVTVFVRAIEAVDPYLCGQSAFTANLAVAVAQYMDVDDESTLATLRAAASLSQIGMIQLPRELLNKTGALSVEERQLLHMHVEYARNALEGIDFGIPVLEAIYQMYERLDGSGYPNKLSGEQICINARILAVASTFCAMMRPRSYRTAHDIQHVIGILVELPPKFDIQVIKALQSFLQTEQGRDFLKKIADTDSDGREVTN